MIKKRLVYIHRQILCPKSLRLIREAHVVISSIPKVEIEFFFKISINSEFIFISPSEINNSNDVSKMNWIVSLKSDFARNKEMLFSTAGAARSEFSNSIQAYLILNLISNYKNLLLHKVDFITDNPELKLFSYLFNNKLIKFRFILLANLLFESIKNFYRIFDDSLRILLLKFFIFINIIRGKVTFKHHNDYLYFSFIKHCVKKRGGLYGEDFGKRIRGVNVIAVNNVGDHQNRHYLKWASDLLAIQKSKNFIVLESNLSLLNIFYLVTIPFYLLCRQLLFFVEFIFIPRQALLKPIIFLIYRENYKFSYTFLSNKACFFAAKNLFTKLKPEHIIYYHYEFPFGRSISKAAYEFKKHSNCNIKTYGFQHGIISSGKWAYELNAIMAYDKHLSAFCPDVYFLEGYLSLWQIRKYIDITKIKIIGAPRNDKIISTNISKIKKLIPRNNTILYLMDLHLNPYVFLTNIGEIIRKSQKFEILVLRPHPRDNSFRKKITFLQNVYPDINFVISKNKLVSDLKYYRPRTVWGNSTSSLLDCLFFGFKVKPLNSYGELSTSPISDIINNLSSINQFNKLNGFDRISLLNLRSFYNFIFYIPTSGSSLKLLREFQKK